MARWYQYMFIHSGNIDFNDGDMVVWYNYYVLESLPAPMPHTPST